MVCDQQLVSLLHACNRQEFPDLRSIELRQHVSPAWRAAEEDHEDVTTNPYFGLDRLMGERFYDRAADVKAWRKEMAKEAKAREWIVLKLQGLMAQLENHFAAEGCTVKFQTDAYWTGMDADGVIHQ
ncbi:hypothetical protein LTS18_011307 [Coniosporium uncinatum]|uniref:Uncharacterized protein n=1 Tax=Coniosporium uncinatum TaxID=93489 RepID=A0ACC3DKC2_9PEZI|nr:hypothetical protein LTS18_011307 [Coniosporium uncinatum]